MESSEIVSLTKSDNGRASKRFDRTGAAATKARLGLIPFQSKTWNTPHSTIEKFPIMDLLEESIVLR